MAQFVQRAAFGLAVKKNFRGANGRTYDWHYQATMLWARVNISHALTPNVPSHNTDACARRQGRKWAKTITTDGTEEFKIICQPEYDNPKPKSFIKPNYKAYDLLPIPCRKQGTLQFDFEIDTETDELKLKVKHRGLLKSGKLGRSTKDMEVAFDLWVPPGSRCLQIWDCVEDIENKVTTAFSGQQQPAGNEQSDGDEAEEMDVDLEAEEQPIKQARNPRRSLRHQASQAPEPGADVDMDAAEPKEEDKYGDGNLFGAAPLLQAQPGPPQQSVADVEMGGMDDSDEIAGSITVAPLPEQPSQSRRGGAQAARRRSRRGSRVSTGIFAL